MCAGSFAAECPILAEQRALNGPDHLHELVGILRKRTPCLAVSAWMGSRSVRRNRPGFDLSSVQIAGTQLLQPPKPLSAFPATTPALLM